MSADEIKAERERCCRVIKECNDRLEEVRRLCHHGKTFVGRWEWRIGNAHWTHICEYCLTPVDHPDNEELMKRPLFGEAYRTTRVSTNPEQEP